MLVNRPISLARRRSLLLLALVAVFTLLVGVGRVVQAAPVTVIVDRTDDNPNAQTCSAAPNDCSLRGAIIKANADPANFYTITFPAEVNTYELTSANEAPDDETIFDLDIMVPLTIDGQGVLTTTIDGNGWRVIQVHSGAIVELKDLTITDGGDMEASGAGILNEGAWLAVRNSRIENNRSFLAGGGLANFGSYLIVEDSAFEGNDSDDGDAVNNNPQECGGAIFQASGTVVIARTQFFDNSSQWGGGAICQTGGELVVRDSTFDSNSSTGTGVGDTGGGAIYSNQGVPGAITTVVRSTFVANDSKTGGAIRSNSDTFFITNSTFSGNSAINGGAINNRLGTMHIYNSTFANNAASGSADSISVETASTTVYNSILVGSDADNCAGALADGGGNVDWYTGSAGPGSNCPGLEADPQLQPLADNGGYSETMAIPGSSPAIDAGLAANCPAADQTGRMRLNDGDCDSGAYDTETTANAAPTTDIGSSEYVIYEALGPVTIDLTSHFSDAETASDALIYEIVRSSDPVSIAVSLNGTDLMASNLKPSPGPAFADVTIKATDSAGAWVEGTVTIRVNYAPTIIPPGNVTVPVDVGTAGPYSFNIDDVDDPTLLCNSDGIVLSAASDNQAVVADANIDLGGDCADREISFTPSAPGIAVITISLDYNGQIGQTGLPPVTAQFTVTVTPGGNTAPVAVGDTATVPLGGTVSVLENGSTSVLTNDTDNELDPLIAQLVNGPTHAADFNLNADGTFSYTHDGTEMIADTFTYRACDGDEIGRAHV